VVSHDPSAADYARLHRYVERRFAKSGRTEWPTVRQAARALRLTIEGVTALVEEWDGPLMLTYYHVGFKVPAGDYFIESTSEKLAD
jgi:hypothetical protein